MTRAVFEFHRFCIDFWLFVDAAAIVNRLNHAYFYFDLMLHDMVRGFLSILVIDGRYWFVIVEFINLLRTLLSAVLATSCLGTILHKYTENGFLITNYISLSRAKWIMMWDCAARKTHLEKQNTANTIHSIIPPAVFGAHWQCQLHTRERGIEMKIYSKTHTNTRASAIKSQT